jgi:hypothetical protein
MFGPMLPTGKARLYWLINLYASGHLDVGTFCKEFEHTYNFEVDKSALSGREREAFAELFEKVVLYSPFPNELATVPFYQSAAQIAAAVTATRSRLSTENLH